MATIAARPPAERRRCDRHVFVVCTGEECRRRGALGLIRELEAARDQCDIDVRVGSARCLGHCSIAPAMVEDGEVVGAVSSRRLRVALARLGLGEC